MSKKLKRYKIIENNKNCPTSKKRIKRDYPP